VALGHRAVLPHLHWPCTTRARWTVVRDNLITLGLPARIQTPFKLIARALRVTSLTESVARQASSRMSVGSGRGRRRSWSPSRDESPLASFGANHRSASLASPPVTLSRGNSLLVPRTRDINSRSSVRLHNDTRSRPPNTPITPLLHRTRHLSHHDPVPIHRPEGPI
jgi:hypothetical protein